MPATDFPKPPVLLSTRTALARLKGLTRTFIGSKFQNTEDLWEFQLELLHLQQSIQRSISVLKKSARQDSKKHGELNTMRALKHDARRLGDAFAWIILDGDRRTIGTLALNNRVPIPEHGSGTTGLILAAPLLSKTFGFPILHDITDFLRIGDVTFIMYKDGRPEIKTVEVKSAVLREERNADGSTASDYEVTLISSTPFPVEPPSGELPEISVPIKSRRPDRRAAKQAERMFHAHQRRTAELGALVSIAGEKVVNSINKSKVEPQWKLLRRIIREARQSGYASARIDETYMCAAVYNPDRITEEQLTGLPLANDVVALRGESGDPLEISIFFLPMKEGGAEVFLPYFLYPIPKRAVLDILSRKLILVIALSVGGVITHLQRAGFDVTLDNSSATASSLQRIIVGLKATLPSGEEVVLDLHNSWYHIFETIYEFKSIEFLADAIHAMHKSALAAISEGGIDALSSTSIVARYPQDS